MKVEKVKIADLHLDPANVRTHPDRNVAAIRASLAKFGQQRPIVVTHDNIVIAGNGTLRAAKDLGWEAICVVRTKLKGSEATGYAIADNRTSELAEWDTTGLAQTLRALQSEDFDLDSVGFLDSEVDELIGGLADGLLDADSAITEDDPPISKADELQAKWATETGQVWIVDGAKPGVRHRIVCGDCTDDECFQVCINGQTLEALVTDPPYGMSFKSNMRKVVQHTAIQGDSNEDLLAFAIGLPATHSKYVWCRWDNIPKSPKPKSVVTWVKNHWSMGDLEHEHGRQTEVCLFYPGPKHSWPTQRPGDVVRCPRTGNDLHPTQKPVGLIAEVISWTSGIVFDPFLGSGTTAVAAEQLGRSCHGIEIDPRYVAVILERLETAGLRPCLEQLATCAQ